MLELLLENGVTQDKKYNDILTIIDTEAKQLQAIEDLYAIAIAQPQYKSIGAKQWKADTKPVTILVWLLRKLGALAKGEWWTIDTYQEERKTRYRFVAKKFYNAFEVRADMQFVALDFLPDLIGRDKPLHDLIVDVMALVSKCNNIPLWDEDGDYSAALEERLQEDPTTRKMYGDRLETYEKGHAAEYLKLLKQRRRKVTVDSLLTSVKAYDANSERKRIIVSYWIGKGISMAATKRDLRPNTFIDSTEKKTAIFTPSTAYKIIWRWWEKDPVHIAALRTLRQKKDNGQYAPLSFSITHPGEVFKTLEKDPYPPTLDEFMRVGDQLFCGQYRDYFYKKILREQEKVAPTTLMERLSLNTL